MKTINQRIENYWDNRSEDFSRVRRMEIEGADFAAWNGVIAEHLPAGKLNILDVGTGAGFFAVLLSKLGHKVTGIDMSTKMIDEARKNITAFNCRADFIKMNAQELDFAAETFDVVITRNLTWTLPDVVKAYSEWHRVLKIGGVLINFDSDYSDRKFTRGDNGAHAEVSDKMLDECTEIKNSLKISSHSRPDWDIEHLNKLGFEITFDENIAPIVHKSPNVPYDNTPLFAIYATKKI